MKSDEEFEHDVQASLKASAAGPLPEELVARIGRIPAREPMARPGLPRFRAVGRLALNLAAAAVLVVAVAALVVSWNGSSLPPGGLPSPSSAVATASLAPSPSVAASPSAATPAASTPTPSAATPAPSRVAVGLRPVSVTFVSADEGWVLGAATCAGGPCAAIARTADGGRTWVGATAPSAPVVAAAGQGSEGISALRFADARNGWAFGPDLWATHDGGETWARLTIPDATPGSIVTALETARGTVHAVVLEGSAFRIASSPIGGDDFRFSAVSVAVGAGPVPSAQLVLSGTAGWLIENNRTVVGGARLVNGAWATWQPPCADVVGPAYLAASSSTELAAACDVGLWGNPTGDHLYVSHDGGSTFARTGTTVPVQGASGATSASPSVVVVGGADAGGAVLVATFDGGRTWVTVARLGAGSLTDLGFTTASQGVVIMAAPGGQSSLLMTRDGGHTWAPANVAGG